jgi:hypothetical protein
MERPAKMKQLICAEKIRKSFTQAMQPFSIKRGIKTEHLQYKHAFLRVNLDSGREF